MESSSAHDVQSLAADLSATLNTSPTSPSDQSLPTSSKPSLNTVANELFTKILAEVPWSPEQHLNLALVNKRFSRMVSESAFRLQVSRIQYPDDFTLYGPQQVSVGVIQGGLPLSKRSPCSQSQSTVEIRKLRCRLGSTWGWPSSSWPHTSHHGIIPLARRYRRNKNWATNQWSQATARCNESWRLLDTLGTTNAIRTRTSLRYLDLKTRCQQRSRRSFEGICTGGEAASENHDRLNFRTRTHERTFEEAVLTYLAINPLSDYLNDEFPLTSFKARFDSNTNKIYSFPLQIPIGQSSSNGVSIESMLDFINGMQWRPLNTVERKVMQTFVQSKALTSQSSDINRLFNVFYNAVRIDGSLADVATNASHLR